MELLVIVVFGITLASAVAIVMARIDRLFGSNTLTETHFDSEPPEVDNLISGKLKSGSSES